MPDPPRIPCVPAHLQTFLLADVPWLPGVGALALLAALVALWAIERKARRDAERALRESLAAEARSADALAQAQRAARDAQRLEAVGRLTSGVAHDFNNLLTAILGYAQFAQMKLGAGHPQNAYLQQIISAAERAEKLTRQLLNFSRQESAGPQAFDLNLVVKETGYLLRRLIGEDVALRMRLAPEGVMMRADSGEVAQLLVHLTMNVRDAMPKGGELWIATETVGEHVTLTIRGSGGIGESADARKWIVPSGGVLEIDREAESGAAFRVAWPLVADENESRAGSVIPEPLPSDGPRKAILVVEDEDSLRRLMSEMLESQGYEVLTASDGENALTRAETHGGKIDLVVTDLVMPRLGGSELVVKLLERRPEIHVLYVSAHADEVVLQRAGETGGEFSLLRKPFDAGTFIQAVREALDHAGPAAT